MQAIHQRGILHRDLKSSNLILGADGHLKIIDFGIAHTFGDPQPGTFPAWHDLRAGRTDAFPMLWADRDNPNSTRGRCGTEGYMCAEIQLGTDYSFNADLWSFGVVLYEWLAAGELPHFHLDDFEEDHVQVHWWPVPHSVLDNAAMLSFLNKIFSVNYRERFEDYGELKAHPMWGPQPDWEAHMERRLPPPDLNV
ncbi:kinase-like domain-containing protein [Roridomyces roridus]|uniref:Kinase-like domain-containing protein n=1 Tax=Roridomyces roridus TaxID=1738132 RepID=A0AAD7FZZ0_9AGAR|nr:kinase-like domain-containing protein [Roridomyces roridus]